jgi:hypothetical protein
MTTISRQSGSDDRGLAAEERVVKHLSLQIQMDKEIAALLAAG